MSIDSSECSVGKIFGPATVRKIFTTGGGWPGLASLASPVFLFSFCLGSLSEAMLGSVRQCVSLRSFARRQTLWQF